MNAYNNQLTMEQLFRNPKLQSVLPQFSRKMPLQNVYSGAEIVRLTKTYLRGAIGGSLMESGENLVVIGKQVAVLAQVRKLSALIEQFFNNVPSVVKNLRSNTRIYTKYSSAGQIEGIKGKAHFDEKSALMEDVLDNLQFNPDFGALNSISAMNPSEFSKEQAAWFKKVGLKIETLGRRK